ncbi:rCG62538 [Rattus norvegicus]|uniref:RCG62538 n=1 Tax=Rattus norvegicus TaxID=10116 RepID=A6J5K4_RAT|nr:rCG62538 [Rattus norvegicus]
MRNKVTLNWAASVSAHGFPESSERAWVSGCSRTNTCLALTSLRRVYSNLENP